MNVLENQYFLAKQFPKGICSFNGSNDFGEIWVSNNSFLKHDFNHSNTSSSNVILQGESDHSVLYVS